MVGEGATFQISHWMCLHTCQKSPSDPQRNSIRVQIERSSFCGPLFVPRLIIMAPQSAARFTLQISSGWESFRSKLRGHASEKSGIMVDKIPWHKSIYTDDPTRNNVTGAVTRNRVQVTVMTQMKFLWHPSQLAISSSFLSYLSHANSPIAHMSNHSGRMSEMRRLKTNYAMFSLSCTAGSKGLVRMLCRPMSWFLRMAMSRFCACPAFHNASRLTTQAYWKRSDF